MVDVEAEEHVPLQFRQVVIPETQVKDDRVRPAFQRLHGVADVRQVRELADDVQAGFLQGAGTGRDLVVRGAELQRLRNAQARYETQRPNQRP